MDDVLGRLDSVKVDLSAITADLSTINAQIPYLATKFDVRDAKNSIAQCMISTAIATTALAFVVAKFVH